MGQPLTPSCVSQFSKLSFVLLHDQVIKPVIFNLDAEAFPPSPQDQTRPSSMVKQTLCPQILLGLRNTKGSPWKKYKKIHYRSLFQGPRTNLVLRQGMV